LLAGRGESGEPLNVVTIWVVIRAATSLLFANAM
jgi:hypothetical protein